MQFNSRAAASPILMRVGPFKGVDYSIAQAQIDDNRSPDMMNMVISTSGDLVKRFGYDRSFATSLGTTGITGMYLYRKIDGSQYFLFSHDENLYVLEGNVPRSLYRPLKKGNPTSFFTINDICYIMDGMNLRQFDGVNLSIAIPYYHPTLTISRSPSGGGTAFEDLNLLSSGFKDSFSADGTSTVYFLSLNDLDSTTVTAEVNGVTMTEGSGFTVDRTNGKIIFATAPSTGTNNVIITAFKTFDDKLFFIRKCQFSILYGGSSDSRVFVGGNPDFPNRIWRSGLFDPTYFPENGFYDFPQTVKGFSKQYDTLIVDLESSKHQISFVLNNGEPSFPSKPINDQIGTLASNSIQLIENSPVSLDKTGVYMLVQSNVRDERNVEHISKRIDAKLLKESNLQNAISIDYKQQYWLGVNGRVYVLDYTMKSMDSPYGEWYVLDNINASCFLEKDGILYFGSSDEGLIYQFKSADSLLPFEDDGQEIDAYWLSKLFDFGRPEFLKIVQRVYLEMQPNKHTSLNLYARSDRKGETFVLNTRMDQLDFNYLDFDRFAFTTSDIPQEVGKKVKMKKITHVQLRIVNNNIDEGLGLHGISIAYDLQNEVKL